MKIKIVFGFFICLVFLASCSNKQTLEEFFHQEMKRMNKDDENFSYALIYTEVNAIHEDDGIAVFKEHNIRGEQIFIAYFEKTNNRWEWKHTRGGEWDTPVKWSFMNQEPYIYSGPISDNSIKEVYAGEEKASIIAVEGNKRFWYVISPIQNVEVFYIREDGTKEKIEDINWEEVEDNYSLVN